MIYKKSFVFIKFYQLFIYQLTKFQYLYKIGKYV